MPEFHLNTLGVGSTNGFGKVHPWYDLDELTRGYIEALFFTNGDTGDEREDLLNDLGVKRLTRASIATIKARVDRFTGTLMPDGCFARQWIDRLIEGEPGRCREGIRDDRRAGHMIWYATQGHGVAWTDDYSPSGAPEEAVAEGLQTMSRAFGEAYVEVWRGWIHVRE